MRHFSYATSGAPKFKTSEDICQAGQAPPSASFNGNGREEKNNWKQRKLEKQTMPANGEDGAEEFLPGEDAADMPAAEDAPASAANHEPVATFEPVNSPKRD